MRVCVKLRLVSHTLKYGTLFDGEELARKATLMRTADRLQTKIGLQSTKCKLMVRLINLITKNGTYHRGLPI